MKNEMPYTLIPYSLETSTRTANQMKLGTLNKNNNMKTEDEELKRELKA